MIAVPKTKLQFLLSYGGMGDLIYQVQPLRYILDTCPHLHGSIIVKTFARDLFAYWFKEYADRVEVTGNIYKDQMTVAPNYQQPDPMGGHLETLAWAYLANRDHEDMNNPEVVPPKYRRLPKIKGNECDLGAFGLAGKYAVICVGATAPNRVILPDVVDELSGYFTKQGVEPVYLGKRTITSNYAAQMSGDLSLGLDLTDKTTAMEAACIMAGAQVVVGIDGGLMHLAGCTDVPVVMALTVSSKRDFSHMRSAPCKVFPADVECVFCQEKYRYVIGHHFRECIENTYACVKSLSAKKFIDAIEAIAF